MAGNGTAAMCSRCLKWNWFDGSLPRTWTCTDKASKRGKLSIKSTKWSRQRRHSPHCQSSDAVAIFQMETTWFDFGLQVETSDFQVWIAYSNCKRLQNATQKQGNCNLGRQEQCHSGPPLDLVNESSHTTLIIELKSQRLSLTNDRNMTDKTRLSLDWSNLWTKMMQLRGFLSSTASHETNSEKTSKKYDNYDELKQFILLQTCTNEAL